MSPISAHNEKHYGSCLCGAVGFEVSGSLPRPDACHWTKCRKFSGHVFVSSDIPRSAVKIQGSENFTWFRSSEKVQRGFCSTCGSSFFFDPLFKDWTAIALGAFDGQTDSKIEKHIFIANRGDCYDINDGLPQTLN